MSARARALVATAALVAGCESTGLAPDSGLADAGGSVDAAGPRDAGVRDVGPSDDGGPTPPLPAPDRVGGALTTTEYTLAPFLTPAPLLEIPKLPTFSFGRELFVAEWTPAPGSRPQIDGLGPLFNATACLDCHPGAGRPPALDPSGAVRVGILFRIGRPGPDGLQPDPILGGQLQPRAVSGHRPEIIARWTPSGAPAAGYGAVSQTSPEPDFDLRPPDGQPNLHPESRAGARLAPHLAGMGLLDRVPDAALLEREDPGDLDGDGISGRAARLPGGRLGRFGWKAINYDLVSQAAGAFAGDMGITSPLSPRDDCTEAQAECRGATHGGEPEVDQEGLEAVGHFMAHLAVPAARRATDDPRANAGATIFAELGCEACHRAELRTRVDAQDELLSDQVFHPYSDLLLHDMGPGLSDAIGEGDASAAEWRTPPLWGLGLVEQADDARFLHDGRATSLPDAIRWHGGEAETAKDAYEGLEPSAQADLLYFLRSL